MELAQLKCFLAVARERNFTRAAKSRHMTQPSLSYQILKLEEELGSILFLRKPRAAELSEAGKLLLESATKIIEEEEKAVARFKRRDELEAGEISFGIIPTMGPYLLPPVLKRFRNDFPAINIVARESRTSSLVKEVVSGDLEFAIVSDVDSVLLKKYSLHLLPLFSENLLLASQGAHPICGQARLTPRSVNEQELILLTEGNCLRRQTLKICKASDESHALVCEQLSTQLSLVSAGLGLAIVPEMAVNGCLPNEITLLRFSEPQPSRIIGLLKKRSRKLSKAATELVQRFRSTINE